jgi:hypothetical protein
MLGDWNCSELVTLAPLGEGRVRVINSGSGDALTSILSQRERREDGHLTEKIRIERS